MRYSRIFRPLGVVLGAATLVVMGLPGAAQAQSIDTTISYSDAARFMVTATTLFDSNNVGDWIVRITKPNGDQVVVHSDNAEEVSGVGATSLTGTDTSASLVYDRNDAGTWWFQVDICQVAFGGDDPEPASCPSASLVSGPSEGYTHGAFPAPMNFAASVVPMGVALTWTTMKNQGFVAYEYSTDGFDKVVKGADASGAMVVPGVEPGEHTFMLRARGHSDNDLNTSSMDPAAAESIGVAATATVIVPETVPTLPEILTILLALTLVGAGVYVIRRKGASGLTPA